MFTLRRAVLGASAAALACGALAAPSATAFSGICGSEVSTKVPAPAGVLKLWVQDDSVDGRTYVCFLVGGEREIIGGSIEVGDVMPTFTPTWECGTIAETPSDALLHVRAATDVIFDGRTVCVGSDTFGFALSVTLPDPAGQVAVEIDRDTLGGGLVCRAGMCTEDGRARWVV